MTKKEVREILFEYKNYALRRRELNDEIGQIRGDIDRLRSLVAVKYDGMPRGSGVGDPTGEAAVHIMDIYEKRIGLLKEKMEALDGRRLMAERLLNVLDETERKVIVARYIKGIRWDHIPAQVYLCRRSCFNYRDRAMEKMMGVEV